MLRLIQAFVAMIALALPATAGPNGITQAESWFYIERNVTKGPLYEHQIVDLAQDGVIRAATQVFEPGRGWTFAKNIPALQPYVGGTPSARPAPQRPQYESGPLVEPVPPPQPPAYVPPPTYVPPPQTYDVPPALPSGSVEAELERALGDYLAGTWQSLVTQDVSGSTFETATDHIFRPGGSYEAVMSVSAAYAPGMQPTREIVSGVWRIRALSPERFVLTIDGPDGVPIDEKTLVILDRTTMRGQENGVTFTRAR